MRERPILFGGEMVRAILAGRKTQTRRLLKPQPVFSGVKTLERARWCQVFDGRRDSWEPCAPVSGGTLVAVTSNGPWAWPYGRPGDRLFVREAWAPADRLLFGSEQDPPQSIIYRADKSGIIFGADLRPRKADVSALNWSSVRWRPSIHMPRWASRITLEIARVRVERLQDISEEDAREEGVTPWVYGHGPVSAAELSCEPGMRTERMYRDGFEVLWDRINGSGSWRANPFVWVVEFEVTHG